MAPTLPVFVEKNYKVEFSMTNVRERDVPRFGTLEEKQFMQMIEYGLMMTKDDFSTARHSPAVVESFNNIAASVVSITYVRDISVIDVDGDDTGGGSDDNVDTESEDSKLVVVCRLQADVKESVSFMFDTALEAEVLVTFTNDVLLDHIRSNDNNNIFIATEIPASSLKFEMVTGNEASFGSLVGGDDDFFSATGCLMSPETPTVIADCSCHETCKTCGYGLDAQFEEDYCLSCNYGLGLLQLYTDGTGVCQKILAGASRLTVAFFALPAFLVWLIM